GRQTKIVTGSAGERSGFGQGRRAVDLITRIEQHVLEQHPHILIVFDKKNPAHQRLLNANGEITGSNSGPSEAPEAERQPSDSSAVPPAGNLSPNIKDNRGEPP